MTQSGAKQLGDLCEFVRGVSFDPSVVSYEPIDSYYPILRAGNIANQLLLDRDLIWVPASLVSEEQTLREGDIVICLSSGSPDVVGKCAALERQWHGSVGAFCGIIRPIEPKLASFLKHWFRSPMYFRWRNAQARGANIQNLRFSELAKLECTLPEESRVAFIANRLDVQLAAIDRARAAAEERLNAAKGLMAAYLREVFGSPELQSHPIKTLGDICHIRLGKMLSPVSMTGTRARPYLRNVNVQWGRFNLSDIAEMDILEKEEGKLALKPGDLLVCEGGEPGRAAVWQGEIMPCYYQKALHRLRPIEGNVDPYFIMYRLWLGGLAGEFVNTHAKTTIPHLPEVRLRKLHIQVPPIGLQHELVGHLQSKLEDIGSLTNKIESQHTDIANLSNLLLREAFEVAKE